MRIQCDWCERCSRSWRTPLAVLAQLSIWAFVALNYTQHVLYRAVPWPAPVRVAGHAILGLQLVSWLQLMARPPLPVNDAFVAAAAAGTVPSQADKRTGVTQPLRSHTIGGAIVPGFDHFCGWLGVSVGLHNRKFFVLFLWYSALLCLFAGALSARTVYDVHGLPSHRSSSGAAAAASWSDWLHPWLIFNSPLYMLLARCLLGAETDGDYHLQTFLMISDATLGACLTAFAVQHTRYVLKNRTTLEPYTDHWDVGWRENASQVLGKNPRRWLLPIGGPGCDGMQWPENLGCSAL